MNPAASGPAPLTGTTPAGRAALRPAAVGLQKPVAGDAAILSAWQTRQAALARIEARGPYHDAEQHSPESVDIYDEADSAITRATATTAQGLLAQAWVGLSYVQNSFSDTNERQNALIRRADFEGLLAEGEYLDWEVQAPLAVIHSLRSMIGEA